VLPDFIQLPMATMEASEADLDLDVYELKMDEIVGRSNENLNENSKSQPSTQGLYRPKINSKKSGQSSKPVSQLSGKITVYQTVRQ